MKILLINPPVLLRFNRYPGSPLAVAQLASAIQNGHEVRIIDLNVEPEPLPRLIKKIKELDPDIIGMTSMSPVFSYLVNIAGAIKKEMDVPIVFGGNHITALPEQALQLPCIDFVIAGEGERSFKSFLDKYDPAGEEYDVPGLGYKTGEGEIRINPPGPLIDPLDDLPPPAWDLLPMEKYRTRLRQFCTSMFTRGCPYSCTFCAAHFTHGKKIRKRSIDHIIEDLQNLEKNYGVRFLCLWDDILTFDRDYIINFCERKLKEGLTMEFWGNTRVDRVDPELLKLMRRAGCSVLTYGVESGTVSTLEKMKKGITTEQTRAAVAWTRQAGIIPHGFIMINFVGETEDEMKRTIDFAMELDLFFVNISAAVPYPGTEYERLYREEIHSPDLTAHDFSDYWSEDVFDNGVVAPERVRQLVASARRRMIMRPKFFQIFAPYMLQGAKPIFRDLKYYLAVIPGVIKEIVRSRGR